jgi:hypothetical protein
MPRYLTDHIVPGASTADLQVLVVDEPGSGGANHLYHLLNNPNSADGWIHPIKFQDGPIGEVGVNGVTHEALLAVLADRLRGFQSGPYASPDNADALAHIEDAQACPQKRTRERMARGVEGTRQA